MLDWFDCPHCIYRHPWKAGERDCPNRRLSEARCQQIFHKPLDKVLKPGVTAIRPLAVVADKPKRKTPKAETPTAFDKAAYQREYMRKKRAEKQPGQ